MAQLVYLRTEALEDRVDRLAQALAVVDVACVGEAQAQRADALDALVVDLPRPASALALARLHPVAQPFDLDRALRRQPLGDARRERAQGLPVGTAEAPVPAQRDRKAAALAVHAEGLDERGARLEPKFVKPRRLLAAGPVQGHRRSRAV